MKRALRIVLWCTALGALASAGAGWWLQQEMARIMALESVAPGTRQLFVIEPGSSLGDVASRLEAEGWLASRTLFALSARLRGVAHRIKAGTYEIRGGDTPQAILERIVAGDTHAFGLTVVEGTTFGSLLLLLAEAPGLRHTVTTMSGADIMTALERPGVHPEGQFFPATYRYHADTTDLELLRRMHTRLQQELDRAWRERAPDLPYDSAYEALIMASIVEKETGRAEERAAIAGVFLRRLKLGMKLQTDPTVIYGLGASFDGNLRRRDLRQDTPYNTYTRHGLPPTPIALSGRAALVAATQPADGKALYFVARGDGSHQFSETLSEHNRAVRRYQLKR